MDRRAQRIGENEALFRSVNEQIRSLDETFGVAPAEPQRFVCECGRSDCAEQISLTLEEYADVRADPARFAIVDGHEFETVEVVVERHDRYAVVRKREGGPAELARRLDPV